MKRFSLPAILSLLVIACAALTPAMPVFPTLQSLPPTSTLTPTITPTPFIPTIEVDGVIIPHPRFSNPELFDLSNPDAPIPRFVTAMKTAGLVISGQGIVDALSDPHSFQARKDINGKLYLESIYSIPKDGVDYATGILYDEENGWREATVGNLADKLGYRFGNNIRLMYRSAAVSESINRVVAHEFNLAILDDPFTFPNSEPRQNSFDFEVADRELALAQNAHMAVRGQALLYGAIDFTGDSWLKDRKFPRGEMKDIIVNHITYVVSHFRGEVTSWIVINEVGNNDGFLKYDPAYPQQAFTAAEDADPDAELIYNFVVNDLSSVHDDVLALYDKVTAKRKVLGIQLHMDVSEEADEDTMVRKLQAYGVPIAVTEFDINMKDFRGTSEEKLQKQAELYQRVIRAVMKSGVCRSISFWETGDKYSWIERTQSIGKRYSKEGDPTLFFDDLSAKPALFAVRAAILSRQ